MNKLNTSTLSIQGTILSSLNLVLKMMVKSFFHFTFFSCCLSSSLRTQAGFTADTSRVSNYRSLCFGSNVPQTQNIFFCLSGLCGKKQREIAKAIKKAHSLGLFIYNSVFIQILSSHCRNCLILKICKKNFCHITLSVNNKVAARTL